MKKYYFSAVVLLCSLLSFPLSASAQSSNKLVYVDQCYGDPDYTIGRVSTNGQYIISYHFSSTTNEFHLSDASASTSLQFKITLPLRVCDFEIFEGFVFFCGIYNGNAVVGYFSEDVFIYNFSQTTPIYNPGLYYPSYNFSYVPIIEVTTMTRLEVYRSPVDGKITIVAVGEKPNYPAQPQSMCYIIPLDNISTVNYDYYTPANTNNYYCEFQDVAITDNYIILSGVHSGASQDKIVMTVFNKSAPQTSATSYYFDEMSGDMNSYHYSIESTKDDEVVISSLLLSYTEQSFVIPLHVFDASIHDFINSQIVPICQKTEYHNEMQYFKEDKSLLLLQRNYYPTTNSTRKAVIYDLLPYNTTSYITKTIYDDRGNMFNTIDRFLDYRFLVSGEMSTDEHAYFIRKKNASFQSSCFESLDQKVKTGEKPQNQTPYFPNPTPNQNNINYLPFIVFPATLINDCDEQ